MIPYSFPSADFDIHGAFAVTGAAAGTGDSIPLKTKNPEEIEDPQERSVGAGVFTKRAFNKEAHQHNNGKSDEGGYSHFSCPELEEGVVGINLIKHDFAAYSSHINNQSQHNISQVPQEAVQLGRDHSVVFSFKNPFPQFSQNLLKGSEGADPSAENRAEEYCQNKNNHHQDHCGRMDLGDGCSCYEQLWDGDHSAEGADGM